MGLTAGADGLATGDTGGVIGDSGSKSSGWSKSAGSTPSLTMHSITFSLGILHCSIWKYLLNCGCLLRGTWFGAASTAGPRSPLPC